LSEGISLLAVACDPGVRGGKVNCKACVCAGAL